MHFSCSVKVHLCILLKLIENFGVIKSTALVCNFVSGRHITRIAATMKLSSLKFGIPLCALSILLPRSHPLCIYLAENLYASLSLFYIIACALAYWHATMRLFRFYETCKKSISSIEKNFSSPPQVFYSDQLNRPYRVSFGI